VSCRYGLFVTPRLRKLSLGSEGGQSLIELLIALTVLAIGIGSTLTIFADSLISMQHAGKEGTAITLADRQLETYQTMPYTCISSTFATPSGCLAFSGFPNPYAASQTTTSADSPDHRVYDVNTAITPQAGSTYQIKITVEQHGTTEVLAQETSDFSSAGQSVGG